MKNYMNRHRHMHLTEKLHEQTQAYASDTFYIARHTVCSSTNVMLMCVHCVIV